MNIEDQENSGIPADEDKPDMAPEGAPGSPIPASDDFEPVQESVTSEINSAAGETGAPVPPVDLPPPAENEPEEEDKPNWMPWAVVAVIVLAVIIVIALAAGGRVGGGAEYTPTPRAPEVIQPYIQIDKPIQGATLDLSSPIMVSGVGRGLFEGKVGVQALDAGGNVLAEQPTTIQSPNAGTGG